VTDIFAEIANAFIGDELAADPVKWAKERCGIHFWSIQREIAHSVAKNKRTAVQSAHGMGKSFLAATLAAWWVDTHDPAETMVVTTAPSLDQVHAILWEEIRGIHSRAGLPGKVQLTDKWVIGDRLVGMGRKPPDHSESAFQGLHRKYVLVILDEACGIPEWLWTAVETITTADTCRILAIGNPDDPNSKFRSICDSHRKLAWSGHKISCFDSPHFTGEDVPPLLLELLTTRQWVEDRKSEWGEENPLYIAKVLGEFPSDHPWSIVRMSDVYQCRIPTPRHPDEMLPVELGIDVGGGGDDTIIRERRGMVAGREWRESTDRPETIAKLAVHAINVTGATMVKVDSNGIGFGLVGELRNLKELGHHNARIVGVNVSEKASRPDKYYNLRAQLWWECGRIAAEQRAWDLSQMENADLTVAQLLEPQYELDLKGRIKVEPKDEIRKRIGRSPDNADALLLAYYQPQAFATDWFEALAKQGRR
jgi:hypothetical protein